MTTADAPGPPPPPPPPSSHVAQQVVAAVPASSTPPVSVLSIISFVLAVVTSISYLTAKTLVPVFDGATFDRQVSSIATAFGVLGLLSFIPIVLGIVFGHLGIRGRHTPRRARGLGVAGLSIGYLLLALYANRMVVAAIATATFTHGGNFLQNNFYWA